MRRLATIFTASATLVVGLAFAGALATDTAYAADNIKKEQDPVSGKKVENTSVIDYIDEAYKWAAVFGGLLAVLMLIYAGYRYMSSYGDPEKISDAKDIIEKALIGLALLILAATILNTINPATTRTCEEVAKQQGRDVSKACGTVDFSQPNGK